MAHCSHQANIRGELEERVPPFCNAELLTAFKPQPYLYPRSQIWASGEENLDASLLAPGGGSSQAAPPKHANPYLGPTPPAPVLTSEFTYEKP